DENKQQRATILEISVPVLPISADTLVMPLVGALDSGRLRQLHEQALHALERSSARRLLLDITGVPVVDSQVAQGLILTVQAGRLREGDSGRYSPRGRAGACRPGAEPERHSHL